jgi:hypothetical protein
MRGKIGLRDRIFLRSGQQSFGILNNIDQKVKIPQDVV